MYEAFKQELAYQTSLPPAGDSRIAAFAQTLLNLADTPKPSQLIAHIYASRPEISPSYSVNLILRAFQRQLLKLDPAYPGDYTQETVWEKAITEALDSPEGFAAISYDIEHRQVQSNVVERYKAFKLIMSLLQQRLGTAPRILDIGCSRNHGLKKLKLNLPFKPVSCGIKNDEKIPYILLDNLFNGALRQTVPLGRCVGCDIVPIEHDEDAEWARSCSFYPSELLNIAATTEYDYLDNTEFSEVTFEHGDFTVNGFTSITQDQVFDVITVSTFLYQLSTPERQRAQLLFREYLSERGVIIYQDFVKPAADQRELQFETNWFSKFYPYRTILEFAGDTSHHLYEVLRWDNGRCNQWLPGLDLSNALQLQ